VAYRTTPKMAQRKQARQRRLLDEAISIFGKKGYHLATVPMIVAAACTSIGSFYFYFRNKEDIFAAALREIENRIAAALNEAITAAGSDVLAQMRAAVTAFVEFLARHPDEARILLVESSGLGPRLEAVRNELIASHTRSVGNALRAVAPRLASIEPAVAANCWVGAVYQSVSQWLKQPAAERLRAKDLAAAIARFNLRGIGAPATDE
jgi:TetR/AcrR family fatty acid metabolism transcriptional regulator